MDLLQTVRKEGSRGGVNFTWDDVKNSQHRENYLGHSVMAPVGRWQKNKDLSWYAKAEDADLTPEERAEKEAERKREEMRKIKEAESDAMMRAMGLPVPDRTNANEEPLGLGKEKQGLMNSALKETLQGDERENEEKGLGFGGYGGVKGDSGMEVMKGSRSRDHHGRRERSHSRERRRRDDDADERLINRRNRSRSRSRERNRSGDRERRRRRHRHHGRSRSSSRSRSRPRDQRRRSSSRNRRWQDEDRRRPHYHDDSRRRERDHKSRRRSRSRSRSPYERRRAE